MTKKDYIVIADVIVGLINSGILDKQGSGIAVTSTFMQRLFADNPKFNNKVFFNRISERI